MRRVLTTVTLLGLLVATAAAFVITEHLKLEKSALFGIQLSAGHAPPKHQQPVVFSPVCRCKTDVARIGFKLRHPNHVTVTIVDSAGHTVATRGNGSLFAAHVPQHVVWDGRTDTGALAPDGAYNPWISLGGHTYKLANKLTVDTVRPKVLSATALKPVLLAGPRRSVAITYAFSKKAHALVYLGNHLIIVGRRIKQNDKIKWNGRANHRQLPAGRYVLSIGARDPAGNEASARQNVTVVLQYVAVTPVAQTVRAGRLFKVHVETATRRYTWRLGQRHGRGRGKTLRLLAPTTPGTYRLAVTAGGHTGTSVVRVHG